MQNRTNFGTPRFSTPQTWTFPHIDFALGIFRNRNPSNLDSSDQRICLFCDLNLNLDYESVDLPLEVDQQIQCPWITHNSL